MGTTPQADHEKAGGKPLTGELCEFNLGPDHTNRRWTVVNLPFKEAEKVFVPELFDPVRGKGEQRAQVETNLRKLRKAALTGEFTPAAWSGGIRKSHKDNVEIDEKKRKVTIHVSPRNPLALLDGGHRRGALRQVRDEAYKNGDKDLVAAVDTATITVQVYLDPDYVRRDFEHLQLGLPVNRSQLRFMAEADGHISEKLVPFMHIYRPLAQRLNEDPESFLYYQVKFTTSQQTSPLEYASITTSTGSDLATSLVGGAKIVRYPGFADYFADDNAAIEFLAKCYNAAYQGIFKYGKKEEFENQVTGKTESFPELLQVQKALRPTILQGTKGGSAYLIMLGNMLAVRMLAVKKKLDIEPKDIKALVATAEETLNLDVNEAGGGSGNAKRTMNGRFVRAYFDDAIKKDDKDETDMRKLEAVDGVPVILCDIIMTRSAFSVPKNAVAFYGAETAEEANDIGKRRGKVGHHRKPPVDTDEGWVDEEPEVIPDEDALESETDFLDEETQSEFSPPPPKPKHRKKEAAGSGLMG